MEKLKEIIILKDFFDKMNEDNEKIKEIKENTDAKIRNIVSHISKQDKKTSKLLKIMAIIGIIAITFGIIYWLINKISNKNHIPYEEKEKELAQSFEEDFEAW